LHNPRMSPRPASVAAHLVSWSLMALLGGCGRAPPPAAPAQVLHTLSDRDGRVEWRAMLPCADCDGIESQLVLRRAGSASDYTLSEMYLVGEQGARFVEHGQWQQQRELLRLRGDGGSVRVYVLLADGRLQQRDAHGKPLRLRREADTLLPVALAPDR
jgi:uncharacterized lipoprotein NlpE involved in copper resistance